MRRLPFALLLLGFGCAALSLGLKAVMPGPRGSVSLAAGDSVELDGGAVLVLKDFRVPKYPSGKPRQYESDVHVVENGVSEPVHATISVNHPLRWNGYWIYQMSYDAATESYTVLEVFRDPWLALAAAGGLLLVLGALLGCFVRGTGVPPVRRRSTPSSGTGILPVRPPILNGRDARSTIRGMLTVVAAVAVFAVPLFIILRAVLRPEPMPALQSPLMAPHVAAYAASYLIMIFAAFGLCRRLLPLGFLLMTLGLVLGALWGKICWGDFWQYDPKEMWSLATWLVYVVYFACRGNRRAETVLRIVGAAMVVLTATWVNFSRFFPGLHNYAG